MTATNPVDSKTHRVFYHDLEAIWVDCVCNVMQHSVDSMVACLTASTALPRCSGHHHNATLKLPVDLSVSASIVEALKRI